MSGRGLSRAMSLGDSPVVSAIRRIGTASLNILRATSTLLGLNSFVSFMGYIIGLGRGYQAYRKGSKLSALK